MSSQRESLSSIDYMITVVLTSLSQVVRRTDSHYASFQYSQCNPLEMGLQVPKLHEYAYFKEARRLKCADWYRTAWDGGSIPLSGSPTWAWAVSTVAVETPSDPDSTFLEHTDCKLEIYPRYHSARC